ncbi:MAG: PPOX class F420-dependent oxidoreductase [Gammaproteobacteria bacterium]
MSIPLDQARYLNLATRRRNGDEVLTPVWFAVSGDGYVCFTASDAGKVKRIRANPRVRIAPCDMRGGLLGPWQDAHASLVNDAAEAAQAYRALRARYGWQMWLLDLFSRLSGRYTRRAVIRLHPDAR